MGAWANEIQVYFVAKHTLCTKFGQKFGLSQATKIEFASEGLLCQEPEF